MSRAVSSRRARPGSFASDEPGREPLQSDGMKHRHRRLPAAALVVAACLSLSACEPAGKAVGDTHETEPKVAHIGEIRSDVTVGLIGSTSPDLDRMALDQLDAADLSAVYVATTDTDDPTAAACQGVADLIERRASIIVISGIDVTEANADAWDQALHAARSAGFPVALLAPVAPPADESLYAATLTVNDRAATSVPLDQALMTIIDDRPHERNLMVSTLH